MHEYSVVASLIELCEQNAAHHQASAVEKVIVSIGERSGMDKSLFMSAFETFREESAVCKNSELEIVSQPVVLECKNCHFSFEPKSLEYGSCPQCGGEDLSVLKGTEMLLLRLELV
ncbi:hydrogenase/urease nickel incorporation protein HypA [Helicobacter mustelae]|uniref:Hydrogenase maturation factor HypA n=1 Tax=Helicobacter mustelae (strain ATCC 43772 / CCUG 25715 / CIP 103759 / LMG 18044 / NCTC 12198 / R85-136P) TaxID=679897 RepID=D3UI41_HELM1|nr:hydrogenase/urease nickel incorporation protein HypA [Helicobacter mustelae]CBG40164.1 hydrogenase expression /formation protein [Helicobacter mustelae 12198]SQH71666.1 hydrogenase expression /formation protein [Helicobacter mustelae]STP12791.1 hydrogenase expression /formation protein [Helicobacter mustelae]